MHIVKIGGIDGYCSDADENFPPLQGLGNGLANELEALLGLAESLAPRLVRSEKREESVRFCGLSG